MLAALFGATITPMRHLVIALCALSATACASSGGVLPARETAPIAVVPRWAEPAASTGEPGGGVGASRTILTEFAPRETVHITAPPERDPVDALIASRRGQRRLRSLTLRDAPVTDTLRMFSELGGFNVVMTDEVSGRHVTLSLRDVSLTGAFRAVLSAAHLGASVVGGEVVEVRSSRAL